MRSMTPAYQDQDIYNQFADAGVGRIAGVVVLYNSKYDIIQNIQTYSNQVDIVYVIDNSDQPNPDLIRELLKLPTIYYSTNNGNLGIAYALNKAAKMAIEGGYTHLLTMDDDSKAPPEMLKAMVNFLSQYKSPEKVGIISTAHNHYSSSKLYNKVIFTMTSGNLLNLSVYQKVGSFQDELFIDQVDHEYGLRLTLNKFEVIELCNLKLQHKLGVTKRIDFFGIEIQFISHNPKRFYYIVRNTTYIIRKYFFIHPEFCFVVFGLSIKEVIKSILFEDQKKIRINHLIKAIKAGWSGQLGKYVKQ